ncbi:MAG: hypothetical protein V4543_08950 [Bacteroidota bacterium]
MQKVKNFHAIAELGILSSANLKYAAIGAIDGNDPLCAFAQSSALMADGFKSETEILNQRIAVCSNKYPRIIFAGIETFFLDGLHLYGNTGQKNVVIVPNSSKINTERFLLNCHSNITIHDLEQATDIIYGDAILFVPFFSLTDGTCWAYSYPAAMLNENLQNRPGRIIGIKLCSNLCIDPDEDRTGSLCLLTKVYQELFHTIISFEPKTAQNEPDHINNLS